MFDRRRYDFILEAVSPIAHASESIGNTSLVMREKRRMADGSIVSVPIITGDTLRHGLREASAYAFLDAAGLLDSPALTEEALRLLFAGGMITGSDSGAVKLDVYRELVELCPPLGLLGGCAQNRAIPGKIQVDAATLICDETAHSLPEWIRERVTQTSSSRAHIEEVQRVRMDPLLDPGKRKLLADGGAAANNRLLSSEHAKEVGDAALAQDSKSSMMPRRHETVIAGSLFSWGITVTAHSALELDTFHVMLSSFLGAAVVGGKRSTGHGRLRALAGNQIAIARPAESATALDPGALAPKVGTLFYEHVRERKERIGPFLSKVAA